MENKTGNIICKDTMTFQIIADYGSTYIQGNLLH